LVPIDTLPNYYETINNPIDLSMIHRKNNLFQYRDLKSFTSDFELLRDNCYKFHQTKTLGANPKLLDSADHLIVILYKKLDKYNSEIQDAESQIKKEKENVASTTKLRTSTKIQTTSNNPLHYYHGCDSHKEEGEKPSVHAWVEEECTFNNSETLLTCGKLDNNPYLEIWSRDVAMCHHFNTKEELFCFFEKLKKMVEGIKNT
jgi:hypothetical protein